MKSKLNLLQARYAAGLKYNLQAASGVSARSAMKLGGQAAALGVETLELARIHERAVDSLGLSRANYGLIKRAEAFFAAVMTPIIETHPAARQSKMDLDRVNRTLNRRTMELAFANRSLRRGILRRKGVEAALKKSGTHYVKLLTDSLQLQKRLRQLTHHVLAAQENEREKISRELRDEIAQTFLGINVRLLSLKQEGKLNSKGLKKEIASTRELVQRSARSVRRTAEQLRKA